MANDGTCSYMMPIHSHIEKAQPRAFREQVYSQRIPLQTVYHINVMRNAVTVAVRIIGISTT